MTGANFPQDGSPDLQARYGRRRGAMTSRSRNAAIVVALLLATLATYAVFRHSEPEVAGVVTNSVVTSATAEAITVELHKPSAVTVTCDIRARDDAGAEVGRRTVTFPPGHKVTTLTFTLTTTARANTGEVENCVEAGH